MRDKGSLHYFEVHAGFVHHTVNANDYTRAQVPGILRSIYAYHTKSRGWSDIGYNFLVDRFGRIWEGRYGGVDRPVVGAHTLGYNDNAFAMSAIGNFELRPAVPGDARGVRRAVRLEAVAARRQRRLHQAVGDHAQLQGDQRPPRRRLHGVSRQVPLREDPADPRARVAAAEGLERAGSSSPTSAGTDHPDLHRAARASDGMAFVLPDQADRDVVQGRQADRDRRSTSKGISIFLNAGDWDRDGDSDMMFRSAANGALYLKRGLGDRQVRAGAAGRLRFHRGPAAGRGRRHDRRRLAGPDGPAARRRDADLPGPGRRRVQAQLRRAQRPINACRQIPIGLWNPDGAPDSLFRKRREAEPLPGQRPGRPDGRPPDVRIDLRQFDWAIGVSDVGLTGHADLDRAQEGNRPGLPAARVHQRVRASPCCSATGMGIYDQAT